MAPQPEQPVPDRNEWLPAMRELEARVARIEERLNLAPAAKVPPVPSAAPEAELAALAEGADAVPILGRALLGLAGAYVLRALTESHAVPQTPGVFGGILYAVFWLVWAARTPTGQRAKTIFYSLTSALVLGPLLWEATLRMRAITTVTAAAVLLVFTVFGLILSWRKNLLIVATIAVLTSVLTAASLLIGSQDVLPFAFLLLAMAAAVEVSACLDHWLSERWLTAAAADLVVLLSTYLVTNANGLPESYVPIPHPLLLAAQLALPAIYLSSTMVRTLLNGFTFTAFETAQLGLAFLLAMGGGMRLASDPHIVQVLAALCLGCAEACYGAAHRLQGRNLQTFAGFGFLLLLAGTRLAIPVDPAWAAWSLLAVAFLAAGRPALAWHGCFFLLSALAASGALAQATKLVLGAGDSGGTLAPLLGETAAAVACYAISLHRKLPGRLLAVALSGAAFWMAAGIGATALTWSYHGLFGALAPHAYCATLRTAVLAWGAVLLAWAGKSWKRHELPSLVYVVVGLGAYRLLLVDLRQDGKAAIVLSLLIYGAALMLLPHFMPRRPLQAK